MIEKKSWTIKEILCWISAKFHSENIQNPLLDAQLLVCHVLKLKSRIDLYIHSEKILRQAELSALREVVKRRLAHEPVAYITNQKYWHNLDLYVDSNVLIPRPETESLLDFIFESISNLNMEPKVIFDFCTGSGCLAIALGKKYPNAKIIACDVSSASLNIAKKNAARNSVDNIEFLEMDLSLEASYEYLKGNFEKADVIVANPPYVSAEEWQNLALDVKNYEPKISLVCENSGLYLGQMIFNFVNTLNLLNEKSIFGMELGHKQPEKLLQNQTNKIISVKSQSWERPLNEWFIMKDFENKERFLMKMNG